MRAVPLAACLFVAILALPAGSASSGIIEISRSGGPFVGAVVDGQTNMHAFATNAPGTECLAIYIPTLYTVRLSSAPPTDTLTLSVGSLSDAGENGIASVSFVANYCTAFDIQVTGTAVEDAAAYVVNVQSVNQGPGGACCAWA